MIYCIKCGKANIDTANFCYGCGERIHKGAEANQGGRPSASAAVTIQPSGNIGKVCPFCQTPFKNEAEIILCPECRMPHHIECWQENNGQCTIFGCKGQGTVRRNAASPVNVSLQGEVQNQVVPHKDDDGWVNIGRIMVFLGFIMIWGSPGVGIVMILLGGVLWATNSK